MAVSSICVPSGTASEQSVWPAPPQSIPVAVTPPPPEPEVVTVRVRGFSVKVAETAFAEFIAVVQVSPEGVQSPLKPAYDANWPTPRGGRRGRFQSVGGGLVQDRPQLDRVGRAPDTTRVQQDQLPFPGQSTQITQIINGSTRTAGQAHQRRPGNPCRNDSGNRWTGARGSQQSARRFCGRFRKCCA